MEIVLLEVVPHGESPTLDRKFDCQPLPTKFVEPTRELALGESKKPAEEKTVEWKVLKPSETKSDGGAKLTLLDDDSILAGGDNPPSDTYRLKAATDLPRVTAIRLEVLPDESLPNRGPGRAENGNFMLREFSVSASPRNGADGGPARPPRPRRSFVQPDDLRRLADRRGHRRQAGDRLGYRSQGRRETRSGVRVGKAARIAAGRRSRVPLRPFRSRTQPRPFPLGGHFRGHADSRRFARHALRPPGRVAANQVRRHPRDQRRADARPAPALHPRAHGRTQIRRKTRRNFRRVSTGRRQRLVSRPLANVAVGGATLPTNRKRSNSKSKAICRPAWNTASPPISCRKNRSSLTRSL